MVNFRDSYFNVDWDLTTKRLKGTFWGKQYDTGRGFAVTVINGGQVVAPTAEVLRLKWEKPDKTSGYVNATIVNGKFIIENIDQMFTVHGSVRADFELSVAGEFVASITFYVNVEKAVAIDAIESSSDFSALQDALADVGDMQAQVDAVIANATVDSEVILARGTEPTLGARLDASDAQLAEFDQRVEKSVNLFNKNTMLHGMKVRFDTGAVEADALFNCSAPIPVKLNDVLTFSDCSPSNFAVIYDANNTRIGTILGTTDYSYAVEPMTKTITLANAAYIRLNFLVGRAVINANTYMVVKGDTIPTSYVPYGITIDDLILLPNNIPQGLITADMLGFSIDTTIDGTIDNTISAALMDGVTDSDKIDNAIAQAIATGVNIATIPRASPVNGTTWLLDRAIKVPNDFTLILDNCYLKLKDAVNDNIIRSANVEALGVGQNINVIGVGNACIDGNAINQTVDNYTYKRIGFLFFNVNGFKVTGFKVKDTHGWGMSFESGCCYGKISHIEISQAGETINQDGINIRDGSHHIDIDYITGESHDDFIALTALGNNVMQVINDGSFGKDIHDINISNIRGKSDYCNIIDIICHDGRKNYNINISNVIDTSDKLHAMSEYGAVINLGNYDFTAYAKIRPAQDGEMYNIKIDNVKGRGMHIIKFGWYCNNIHITNITARDDFDAVFNKYSHQHITPFNIRDIFIDGVYADRLQVDSSGNPLTIASWRGAIFKFIDGDVSNLSVKNVKVGKIKNIFEVSSTGTMIGNSRFSNFDISETSHQVYSVKNDNVKMHLDNFYCMDRSKIYQSDVAKTTQFYSTKEAPSSVIEIGVGMPEILAIDVAP